MIFFDIDDTLLDYKASEDSAARDFAQQYVHFIIDVETFPVRWQAITARFMSRYLAGELSFREQRRHRVQEALNLKLTASEADRIFDDYYQIYEASWCLFPEVKETLSSLKRYPLGIITNGDKEHQCYKLEKLGILACFDHIITPTCAGAPKPDLAIFEYAAAQAGKPVGECWYIGDDYKVDYCGARNAGFNAIWLNRSRDVKVTAWGNNYCKGLGEILSIIQAS